MQVLAIAGVIYSLIGPSILVGLAIMLSYVPVINVIARRQKRAQAAKQHAADERIKVSRIHTYIFLHIIYNIIYNV